MFCSPPHVLLAASPGSSSLLIDVCGSMAAFMEEEMAVDDVLGYPKAYARLCRAGTRGGALCLPYTHGSPGAFLPYVLQTHEAAPTANPCGFANLLWKQLNHLGNAGFDPALFHVDAN
ncbi:hypothetical protein D1007_31959 [Hordeum vulgare]|nr:hypothetical protein D1007_31959 [Hordeum vulgare]